MRALPQVQCVALSVGQILKPASKLHGVSTRSVSSWNHVGPHARNRYLPIRVINAVIVDSTPARMAGSGEILNRGEWWVGTGSPP